MLQRVAALATWWQHVATYIAQQLLLKQLESLARAEKTIARFRHRSLVREAGEADAPAVSERSTICAVASSTIVLSFLLLAVPCRQRIDGLNAARCPHVVRRMPARCLHVVRTLSARCLHVVCTLSARCLHVVCRMSAECQLCCYWTLTLTLTHTRGADRLFDWKNMLRHR